MSKYRAALPQLGDHLFLSDGGLETSLIYDDGIDLPYFAAFDLMKDEAGQEALRRYYRRYATIARSENAGFIIESPTWRANPDWGRKLGYGDAALEEINRQSIALMRELRAEFENPLSPIVISGCIGPRGDGYDPGALTTLAEAVRYHSWQVGIFADAGADMVTAHTMNNIVEAVGVARAAKMAGMPVVISFTVETDGRLPTGDSLKRAIETVDATSDSAPAYYMINCAHPSHFAHALDDEAPWARRIRGIRANASRCSHAELDAMTELDSGNPTELAFLYRALKERLPALRVLGGCCGTNHHHISAIGAACL